MNSNLVLAKRLTVLAKKLLVVADRKCIHCGKMGKVNGEDQCPECVKEIKKEENIKPAEFEHDINKLKDL